MTRRTGSFLTAEVRSASGRERAAGCEAKDARTLALRAALPPHTRGQKIGLLGGSFNPPHRAHRMVSLFALKRLGLDRVWWLVTPGNPLKSCSNLPSLATRVADARRLGRHPRIAVTGIEAALGTRFTIDTLRALRRLCPGVSFVWLMGADNLSELHRWRRWRDIARLVPIAVIDRAGATLTATAAPAAQALRQRRVGEASARTLPWRRPPAWVYLFGLKSPISSTRLRAQKTNTGPVETGRGA